MSYILKSNTDSTRLDEQSNSESYSLAKEFNHISFKESGSLLDAGCGSGVFSRYIDKRSPGLKYDGCDLSLDAITYAEQKSSENCNFFTHNFILNKFTNKYDYIVNRLVAHHLTKNQFESSLNNFYTSLKPGGELILVDLDGLFINIGTESESLLSKIHLLQKSFVGNLNNIRYAPALMEKIGFSDISFKIDTINFTGKEREKEVIQWKERFSNSFDFYLDVLGSEFEAKKFFKEYLIEIENPNIPLFYNKFIVQGIKR